jgi:hypothetical protein
LTMKRTQRSSRQSTRGVFVYDMVVVGLACVKHAVALVIEATQHTSGGSSRRSYGEPLERCYAISLSERIDGLVPASIATPGSLRDCGEGLQEDDEFRRGAGSSNGSRRAQPRVENVEECPCGVVLYAAPWGMPIGSSEGCWLASARAIDTTCGGRCTATALREPC